MHFFATAGAAAALALSVVPATAALAAPPAASVDAHMAAALDLARLVNESNQLERQIDLVLETVAAQAFAADPDLATLKELYPGVEKMFLDTMRPIVLSELALMLPEYNDAVAQFYAGNFTTAEIGELATFWRSDSGQALLHSVSSNIDFAATSKEIVGQIGTDAEFNVSGGAVDADKRKAAVAGIRQLTPQQRIGVMRFGLTPTGRKMAALVEQKNEIDRKWANRKPSPEAEARIEREVGDALLAYIEQEERKRAEAP